MEFPAKNSLLCDPETTLSLASCHEPIIPRHCRGFDLALTVLLRHFDLRLACDISASMPCFAEGALIAIPKEHLKLSPGLEECQSR